MTAQPSDPGVYITPSQMYQEVRALSAAMGRVETRLDQILAASEELTAGHRDLETRLRHLEDQRLPERAADHEDRLRHLEERRWPHSVVSLVAAAGATIALVWQATGR